MIACHSAWLQRIGAKPARKLGHKFVLSLDPRMCELMAAGGKDCDALLVWRRSRSIMTVSDYFTFFLTGEKVGDASTAALTGLYDLETGGWWRDALQAFGLEDAQLSVPLLPGSEAGRLTPQAAAFFNLPRDLPVFVGALDHHAAAIGSGVGAQVDAALSSGTVLAALVFAKDVTPMTACLHGPGVDGRSFFRLAFDSRGAGRLEYYQRAFTPDCPASR